MSGRFLNKKKWHPANKEAQKVVELAEAAQVREQAKILEYKANLKKEVETEDFAALAVDASGRPREPPKVDFMYAAPPGLVVEKEPPLQRVEPRRVRESDRRFDVHDELRKRNERPDAAKVTALAVETRDRLVYKVQRGASGCDAPFGRANEGYDLVPEEEEDDNHDDAEAAFLASLTAKEKKALLKRLGGNDANKKQKRKKKRGKKKKKKRSDSSSSSSSSDSDDSPTEKDSDHPKKKKRR